MTARDLILKITPGMPIADELQQVIAIEATRFLCDQEPLPAGIDRDDAAAFLTWHRETWSQEQD
jgi:hypothetical protein